MLFLNFFLVFLWTLMNVMLKIMNKRKEEDEESKKKKNHLFTWHDTRFSISKVSHVQLSVMSYDLTIKINKRSNLLTFNRWDLVWERKVVSHHRKVFFFFTIRLKRNIDFIMDCIHHIFSFIFYTFFSCSDMKFFSFHPSL